MTNTTIHKALISSFSLSASPTSDSLTNLSVISAPHPPPPRASHNEIQVRVLYAGFSGADVNMARGTYPLQRKPPLTPGYCLVGTVAAVPSPSSSGSNPGRNGHVFVMGEYVAAVTEYDAQAEVVNLPVGSLVPVPRELILRGDELGRGDEDNGRENLKRDYMVKQITALALDWNTAHGMVERAGRVRPGDVVFIHGLSGAVGQALLSLCLLKGALVYGTASTRNHAALLGRHENVRGVWDYRGKEWIEGMKSGGVGGADVVFDALGFESWDESYSILSWEKGGVLVGYGGNQGALRGDESARRPWWYILKLLGRGVWGGIYQMVVGRGKRTRFYYIKPGTEECERDLSELMRLLAEGKIEVPIKGVWDLHTEGLREAHRSWGRMQGMGSMLIRVAGVNGSDKDVV